MQYLLELSNAASSIRFQILDTPTSELILGTSFSVLGSCQLQDLEFKKKHEATPNISDGRSKSLNLRGRGVWIGGVGGVNSTQGLAYQTQGLQSHDGVVGLQGVLFDHTP